MNTESAIQFLIKVHAVVRRGPAHLGARAASFVAGGPRCARAIAAEVRGEGVELGGPSQIFERGGAVPVYPFVRRVDNHTFHPSGAFRFDGKPGVEFRCAGPTLDLPDASCDFVLSSHMLEHVANPMLAVKDWRRVLKPGGHLVLVLPDARRTFDHLRRVTTIEHLEEDMARGVGEDDRTHIAEALDLQDRAHWTFNAGDLREAYLRNAETRQVHHHVFDLELARELVRRCGFNVRACERAFPFNLIVFAQR